MSEDTQGVSLDMLETRLKEAEAELVTAMKKRALASTHLRSAMNQTGSPVAMGIVAALDRFTRQAATTNHHELLLRWAVEFQVDLFEAGLEKVCVSGSEPLRIWDQARNLFGHQVPMQFDNDQRENLNRCADEPGTVGVLGWMTSAGSGQWWPTLNESRYQDLRIIGSWPVLDEAQPYAAIVARGPIAELPGCRTLLMSHDDHHRVQRIFKEMDLQVNELSRARSLVMFEVPASLPEDDARVAAARTAGLDGLRVVGSLPGHVHAANDDAPAMAK